MRQKQSNLEAERIIRETLERDPNAGVGLCRKAGVQGEQGRIAALVAQIKTQMGIPSLAQPIGPRLTKSAVAAIQKGREVPETAIDVYEDGSSGWHRLQELLRREQDVKPLEAYQDIMSAMKAALDLLVDGGPLNAPTKDGLRPISDKERIELTNLVSQGFLRLEHQRNQIDHLRGRWISVVQTCLIRALAETVDETTAKKVYNRFKFEISSRTGTVL